jgi:hypothetical protein
VLLSGTRGWLFGWKKIEGSTSEHVVLYSYENETRVHGKLGTKSDPGRGRARDKNKEDEPKPGLA